MSDLERASWATLLVNVVVGVLCFGNILSMPAGADLMDPRATGVSGWFITAMLIMSAVLLRFVQKRTGGGADKAASDERDVQIRLRASRNAYVMLGAAVTVLLVHIVLRESAWGRSADGVEPRTVLQVLAGGPLQAIHVGLLLLMALWLAAVTLNASRVFFYRRGY